MAKQKAMERSLLPVFTERFFGLFGENETQEEFGNRLGLSRNTIAQYLNGHRIPDSITLKQICERCNVSADWLLGLSDVKKPDADLQAVSKYTKLLPESLTAIKDIDLDVLNCILFNNSTLYQFKKMLKSIKEAYMQYDIKNYVLNMPKIIEEWHADSVDIWKVIAGKCTEKIVDEIINMDEPLSSFRLGGK